MNNTMIYPYKVWLQVWTLQVSVEGQQLVLSNSKCLSERKLTRVFKALGARFPVVSRRGIPLSYQPWYLRLPSRSISDAPAPDSLILGSLWKPKRLSWNWLIDPGADTTKSCLVTESWCCIDGNYSQRGTGLKQNHSTPQLELDCFPSVCIHFPPFTWMIITLSWLVK